MNIRLVLNEYETSLSATNLSPNTVRFYCKHIGVFLREEGVSTLSECTITCLEHFLKRLKDQGAKESYRNIHYRSMKRFFDWVSARPHLAQHLPYGNPVQGLAPLPARLEKPQALGVAEVKKMLEHVKRRSRYPKRDEAILSLLFDTGMRRGELVGLRFEDIDWNLGVLEVSGKMGRRQVFASKRSLRVLKRYVRSERKEAHGHGEWVFTGMSGKKLKAEVVTQLVRKIAIGAGVHVDDRGKPRRYIGPHALRHGFALTYLKNGGNQLYLKEAMGHKSLHMTDRYVNPDTQELAKAQQAFSPLERLKRIDE